MHTRLAMMGCLLAAMIFGGWGTTLAEPAPGQEAIATVIIERGKVSVSRPGSKANLEAKKGMILFGGDTVVVGEISQASLLMQDGSVLKLNENTNLLLQPKDQQKKQNRIKLLLGYLWAKIEKQKNDLEIETPSAVAAIKGTELELKVLVNGETLLIVWDGLINFSNEFGGKLVGASFQSRAQKGQAPEEPRKVDLDKLDQWFQSIIEVPATKTLKATVKDKNGQEQKIMLQYRKK